ncbi:hypothetical protein D9613_009471 [Agrocybe pediades]|uniref:Cytochrome P450 n=1 Tax=Agrocybe pediades TaxID=84607 RepID=A0A8H4R4V5_9AGAR|nr:hypothetical protein D9613_009471 [Agrocybe pediades]
MRNIARPFFTRDRFSDFDMFERHCTHTLSRLNTAEGSECVFEAQDLYSRFSIDTASEFLFGKNLDTLSGSLPVPGESSTASATNSDHWGSFTQAFDAAKENITLRGRLGAIWPLFELFKDRNEQNCDVIRQWVDPLVQHALDCKGKMAQAGVSTPIDEKNFLQHLADSIDDPVLIRDQLISMLLASRDTPTWPSQTACVLTFITYFMSIHPEVAEKLRAEVLDHCGSTLPPTFEHFKQMKYMRAVINETLRLFPPLPLNLRECRDEPCVLPPPDRTYSTSDEDRQPLYMPANTTLLWVPLLIHRNPTLWGNDADEFKPERWIDSESLSKFIANPMMFTPFSAGPRICVGQNYAYNEMSYFLVRLLQQYDRFTLAPEFQSPDSLPPPEWKQRKGRQAVEKIWPSAALTLYVKYLPIAPWALLELS